MSAGQDGEAARGGSVEAKVDRGFGGWGGGFVGRGTCERFCEAYGRTEGVGATVGSDWDLFGAGIGGVGHYGGGGGGDAGGGEISGEEVVWNGWSEGAGWNGADDGGFCLGIGKGGRKFFCKEES